MIFVTVGSSKIPFDRLLRAVDALDLDERVVVQHGTSTIRPTGSDSVAFLDHEDFVDLVQRARVTITHAGVGSIMTCLFHGKRPMAVPRLGALGEAVDDHQVSFARRASELGLVDVVEDVADLQTALGAHGTAVSLEMGGCSPIENELRAYIQECVGPETVPVLSEGSGTWL